MKNPRQKDERVNLYIQSSERRARRDDTGVGSLEVISLTLTRTLTITPYSGVLAALLGPTLATAYTAPIALESYTLKDARLSGPGAVLQWGLKYCLAQAIDLGLA